MIKINENFNKLQASYLFSDIAKRVAAYQQDNPSRDVIKLGIGDVTRALPEACVEALHKAVDEMAEDSTFRGYGPEQGYEFLRESIAREEFQAKGIDIAAEAFADFRNGRDKDLAAPRLLYPAVQFNMRGGAFPEPESNGQRYFKIPVKAS